MNVLRKMSPDTSETVKELRPQFREIARSIIAGDRRARRQGVSQNTIGEIERALVKAFVLGREAGLTNTIPIVAPPNGAIDWNTIPPRSRETLVSMTFRFSERLGIPDYHAYEIERFTQAGRVRWAIVSRDSRGNHSVADGSVAPLVRMGLIAPIDTDKVRHALTPIGLETCRDYWRRSDADDPTLPISSIR